MKTSYILEHQNSVKHPTFRNIGSKTNGRRLNLVIHVAQFNCVQKERRPKIKFNGLDVQHYIFYDRSLS